MASLRKASAYSKKKVRPFTRKAKTKKYAYIKAVPPLKLVKYNMGNVREHNRGNFKHIIRLIAGERVQLRDNAIEAGRMLLNKQLDEDLPGQYYLEVKVHPHHVLRDNKTAAGAGADRLSSGMTHSYGTNVGRAALVKPGKEIFMASCPDENSLRVARKAFAMVKSKVPCRTSVKSEKLA